MRVYAAYMDTYMHACMLEYLARYSHRHACIHTYIHTEILHTPIMHGYVHSHIRTYVHTFMHACMRACTHTYLRFNVNMASVKQGGNLTSNQYDISVVRRFRGQPTKQHAINSAFGSSYVPPKRYIAEELSLTPHQFWAYRSFWCGSFPACCTF